MNLFFRIYQRFLTPLGFFSTVYITNQEETKENGKERTSLLVLYSYGEELSSIETLKHQGDFGKSKWFEIKKKAIHKIDLSQVSLVGICLFPQEAYLLSGCCNKLLARKRLYWDTIQNRQATCYLHCRMVFSYRRETDSVGSGLVLSVYMQG